MLYNALLRVDRPTGRMLESFYYGERGQVWLRRQVVALEIEGSNPFAHPTTTSQQ